MMPVAGRLEHGTGYTGKLFNADLGKPTKGSVCYSKGQLTSHSCRVGMAMVMGKAGFSDAEIQMIGRWNSTASLN